MDLISGIYARAYADNTHANFGALFDSAVEKLNGVTNRSCLPVCNGTAAIEVACRMQFIPGNRILVPDYTHAGTIQAVVAAGCVPVMCGTLENTWTLPLLALSHPSINGAVVVSPFGYPVDTYRYDSIAHTRGVKLVYDFAGAWGEFPNTPNPVCYSLHATKTFACGEGGIISFAKELEWSLARRMTNFYNDPDRIVRSIQGRNHKPSELLCAVILAHFEKYDELMRRIENKRALVNRYVSELGLYAPAGGSPSLCVLEGFPAYKSQKVLNAGIEMKQYFPPFPKDLCESLSRTSEDIVKTRYALPSDVTYEEASHVIRIVKEAMECNN